MMGKVEPEKLVEGPIRREKFSKSEANRILLTYSILKKRLKISIDEWVDDFKRDKFLENELLFWEVVALQYEDAIGYGKFTQREKHELFTAIMKANSFISLEATIENKFSKLSLKEAFDKSFVVIKLLKEDLIEE